MHTRYIEENELQEGRMDRFYGPPWPVFLIPLPAQLYDLELGSCQAGNGFQVR